MVKVLNLLKNKKLTLVFILLNFIGIFAAWYTYSETISIMLIEHNWYLIPLVPISFILYFFMAIILMYIYFDLKIPKLFGALTFCLNFAYGFGSLIFYILFIVYIDGFSIYHFWNIFAHGFLGLQSLLLINYLKKIKILHYFIIGILFLIKDFSDLFLGTFDYFIYHDFGILKFIIFGLILILQITSIAFLYKFNKV